MKTEEELGFSMTKIDEHTILVKGVVQGNVSEEERKRQEESFSEVYLHLFDREYVEMFQKIEVPSVKNCSNNINIYSRSGSRSGFKEILILFAVKVFEFLLVK